MASVHGEMNSLIDPGTGVTVNGENPRNACLSQRTPVQVREDIHGKNDKVVLAYYKPVGVTCTERDRFADRKITDMVRFPVRVTYAGRLDKDSEGLILLTNDGELINAMMKGSVGHEKEYIVKLNKEITEDFIQKMGEGVWLPELKIKTRPCKAEQIGKFTFRIILTQGVNRQIRRMSKALGYEVKELKRIRVVNIELAKLKKGEYRRILGAELQALYDAVYQ